MSDDKKQVDLPDMIKALRKGKKIYDAFEDALEIADMLSASQQVAKKLDSEIAALNTEKTQLDAELDAVFAKKEELVAQVKKLENSKKSAEQDLAEITSDILAKTNAKALSITIAAETQKVKLEEEIKTLVRNKNAALKEYEVETTKLSAIKYQIAEEKARIVKALG